MEQPAIVDLLSKSALFGSLPDPDRAAIANRMRRVEFAPDQMIFSRGDPGREIYLVLEGRIRLSILSSDGRELSFAHAGPGNIFGEIATLDGGERTAGATAISRVKAMTLPQRASLRPACNEHERGRHGFTDLPVGDATAASGPAVSVSQKNYARRALCDRPSWDAIPMSIAVAAPRPMYP